MVVSQQDQRRKLANDERARLDLFDTGCRGLLVEVRKNGTKVYFFRYTDKRGIKRQKKLANAEDLTLAQVRNLVSAYRSQIALGNDPFEEKTGSKAICTFEQFVHNQYLPYIKTYKRSWLTDWSLLKNHLIPRFGNCYMNEIDRQSIQKMHHERRMEGAAPGSANRLLIMMRYIFNLAIKWEINGIDKNPCKGIPLAEENNQRERYLTIEEARRLNESVTKSENRLLSFIVPMLILTGARKREVLDARWRDFDITRRIWRIPVSKSGKARHIPLSDGVLRLLKQIPDSFNGTWLFANPKTQKPFVSIYCAWDTARRQAGLSDVRIHDLRHSFASLLINSGRSLYEVQLLLGHAQVKTTQRYAHLSQDTLLAAANTASSALSSVMLSRI